MKSSVEKFCKTCQAKIICSTSRIKNSKSGFVFCNSACFSQYNKGINHARHNQALISGNLNRQPSAYKLECFAFHEKKCIICGESNLVTTHHFDLNFKNNHITNLISLCATHHQYLHSKYKHLIEDQVISYHEQFLESLPLLDEYWPQEPNSELLNGDLDYFL